MRLTIALVIGLAAVPAAAQRAPITKLLDRVPGLLGSGPKQPSITLPQTPVIVGLTKAADRTMASDPATYDLGGFRLGMSEAEAEAVAKGRGLTTKTVMRYVDFETQVRSAINMRGGAAGVPIKRGVPNDGGDLRWLKRLAGSLTTSKRIGNAFSMRSPRAECHARGIPLQLFVEVVDRQME